MLGIILDENRMMRLLLGIAAVSVVLAQPSPSTLKSFEQVWKTVQEKHWDPAYLEKLPNGKSWTQIHTEYRKLMDRADGEQQARAIIQKMLGELSLSHYAILSGLPADDLQPIRGGEGTPEIDPMLLDDSIVVRGVRAGGPAQLAGVKRGWKIVKVDGFDIQQAVERITKRESALAQRELLLRMLVLGHLSGAPGSKVEVVFADGQNQPITKSIPLKKQEGTISQFGHLPPQLVEFQKQRVRPNIGYVRFNLFLDPANLMPQFQAAVKECLACRALIIDLRGNPGGLAILAASMSGFFIEEPNTKLGTLYQRNLTLKLTVNPRLHTFKGKVAVLVDGTSVSTSEIMAGGLQDLKRAKIFGTTTAGAALPSMIERLPNGDLFQYAMANYISEGGKTLEGRGVVPDTIVKTTRRELLANIDPVLDAAIKWANAQAR